MAWTNWSRKSPEAKPDTNAVVGLDVNSSRARAAYGPTAGTIPRPLSLDDSGMDLPLTISLDGRSPEVGQPGTALVRRMPHVVCRNYLPELGQAREWRAGRHRLDAAGATACLVQRLCRPLTGQHALALAVPSYLTLPQVTQLTAAFEHARLPILGTVTTPLALAATNPDAKIGTHLVADADDHGLTWTVIMANGEQIRILASLTFPLASTRVWLDALLDGVSDRCVRMCRRDPRDSASAEQGLYEQLLSALDRLLPGHSISLHIRSSQWFQEMSLAAEEFEHLCSQQIRNAVEGMRQALARAHAAAPVMAQPDAVWLTADAARLPGLVTAVGQNLPEPTVVRPLPPHAVALAAHSLACSWLRGDIARGHLDAAFSIAAIGGPILRTGKPARVK